MSLADKNATAQNANGDVSECEVDLIAENQRILARMQQTEHPDCLFCGKENPLGFKLDFRVTKPGKVQVFLSCNRLFQSYAETLHGGVISAVLDAAMTNALFSLGIVAVTGELTVRFIRQVDLNHELEAVASVAKIEKPLYRLTAELRQSGRLVSRASATFVDKEWSTSRINSTPDIL
jgi:acyl-coenzyme A thioesterase PaaI-like protein